MTSKGIRTVDYVLCIPCREDRGCLRCTLLTRSYKLDIFNQLAFLSRVHAHSRFAGRRLHERMNHLHPSMNNEIMRAIRNKILGVNTCDEIKDSGIQERIVYLP